MDGQWYSWAILDVFDLSDTALRTYLCVCVFERDGFCDPSLRKLADAVETDRSRVGQSLKEPASGGAIYRDRGDPTGWAPTTCTLVVWANTTGPTTPERKEPRLRDVEIASRWCRGADRGRSALHYPRTSRHSWACRKVTDAYHSTSW
jgi:hypothetical protein